MSTANFPLITTGMVVSHHPESHGVYVMLRSGQVPTQPVIVGSEGPADGLRVHHESLPTRGTWGVVVFPDADPRNGVWIKSIYTQQQDAITSDAGSPFTHYLSEWSGYWEHRDDSGNESRVFPDGTSLTYSETGAVPATYRHIVNPDQSQSRVELTQAERVASPPAPFIFNMNHASGTKIQVDSAGNVSATGNPNASLTLTFGSSVLTIASTGDISLQANGNTLSANASAINFTSGNAAPGDAATLATLIVNWLSGHTHTGVNGETSTPVQSLTESDVASTIVKISS